MISKMKIKIKKKQQKIIFFQKDVNIKSTKDTT